MSRPRTSFGSTGRGRLPSTMIRVLAAEMSDPQRHRRGKRYAADDAVLDISIEPGIVTCEVQGSRATPYVASLLVKPGDGMPLRRDVNAHCTCPDDDNFEGHACKHVIATMYAFSGELMLEPELLDLWRGNDSEPNAHDGSGDDSDDGDDREPPAPRGRRHLTLVAARTPPESDAPDLGPEDPLATALAAPSDSTLPPLPSLERFDQAAPARLELAAVLRDALAHLRVEWD